MVGNQNTYIPQKVPYYLKYIVRIKIVIVNINIRKTTGSKIFRVFPLSAPAPCSIAKRSFPTLATWKFCPFDDNNHSGLLCHVQKHATCSSSWLSRSRSWHKVATCFLNFVDLRFFWIFCLALLCIFLEAVTPTNIGCCTHLGKQKRVAVKYANFTPSFYQKIKRRFCAVKKQIGTFLPVFPCVTIHVSFWLSCFSTVDSVSYVSLCVCFKVWLQG